MKFSEVLDADMKMLGQLINMIQTGEYSLNGKDLCASADTIRWLQTIAVDAARSFKESKASENPPKVQGTTVGPTAQKTPSPFGEGVSITKMHKAAKK